MAGTTIAKGRIPDIRTYTKEGFKRNTHDKISIVSMGMNARFKVDSHFSNTQLLIYYSKLRMFRV